MQSHYEADQDVCEEVAVLTTSIAYRKFLNSFFDRNGASARWTPSARVLVTTQFARKFTAMWMISDWHMEQAEFDFEIKRFIEKTAIAMGGMPSSKS